MELFVEVLKMTGGTGEALCEQILVLHAKLENTFVELAGKMQLSQDIRAKFTNDREVARYLMAMRKAEACKQIEPEMMVTALKEQRAKQEAKT